MTDKNNEFLAELKSITADVTFSNLPSYYQRISELKVHGTGVTKDGTLYAFIMPDGGATAAAVAAAGTALITFLQKAISSSIKEAIEEVREDLNQIKNLLKDVERALEALEIRMRRQFVDGALMQLSAISSVRADNIEGWESILQGGDEARKDATRVLISNYLLHLQENCYICIEHGYAAFHTLSFTLIFESQLLDFVDVPLQTKKYAYTKYITFFNDQLNPYFPDTIANRQRVAREEIQSLENRYVSINQQNIFVGTAYWGYDSKCDVHQTINGDIINGFTGSITPVNIIIGRREPPRPFLPSHPGYIDEALLPFRNNLNTYLLEWNGAVVKRRELITKLDSLGDAESNIRAILDKTQQLYNVLA